MLCCSSRGLEEGNDARQRQKDLLVGRNDRRLVATQPRERVGRQGLQFRGQVRRLFRQGRARGVRHVRVGGWRLARRDVASRFNARQRRVSLSRGLSTALGHWRSPQEKSTRANGARAKFKVTGRGLLLTGGSSSVRGFMAFRRVMASSVESMMKRTRREMGMETSSLPRQGLRLRSVSSSVADLRPAASTFSLDDLPLRRSRYRVRTCTV
jgi:hypothetical protein